MNRIINAVKFGIERSSFCAVFDHMMWGRDVALHGWLGKRVAAEIHGCASAGPDTFAHVEAAA